MHYHKDHKEASRLRYVATSCCNAGQVTSNSLGASLSLFVVTTQISIYISWKFTVASHLHVLEPPQTRRPPSPSPGYPLLLHSPGSGWTILSSTYVSLSEHKSHQSVTISLVICSTGRQKLFLFVCLFVSVPDSPVPSRAPDQKNVCRTCLLSE